jgi:hypothetical protein
MIRSFWHLAPSISQTPIAMKRRIQENGSKSRPCTPRNHETARRQYPDAEHQQAEQTQGSDKQ